ncbi:MAG: hypothetical protein J7539_18805 [Niabella sp.]|nr:hypothetical protein [Niabella sp.]
MEEPKDDFFEHIKQVLRNHEEGYREGAWEQFSGAHQSAPVKKIGIWKWVAAAAVIAGILFAAPYLFTNHNNPSSPAIATTTDSKNNTPARPDSNHTRQTPAVQQLAKNEQQQTKPTTITVNPVSGNRSDTAPKAPFTTPSQPENAPPGTLAVAPKQNTAPPEQPVKDKPGFWQPHVVPERENRPEPESNNRQLLAQNTPPEPATKERSRSKKWTPSLYLSPMFAESGVNMGYGVALAYAVNDRVKVSAGIAHNKISTSKNYDAAGSSSALNAPATFSAAMKRMALAAPAASPTLKSVQGVLSGFDIPVDVSYALSKKLYATAGVSGLVVVNDNTNYTLVTSSNTQISVVNSQGVLQEDKRIVTNAYASSSSPTGDLNHDKTTFLGFYNVSVGYKQKITPRNNVSIEPFLKVPVKTVTNQSLNYTGMGIRLKFDF